MDTESIRTFLKSEMESDQAGLREMQERTGVSFSTLSRFLRGRELSGQKLEKLYFYSLGQKAPKRKEIIKRRVTVKGQVFMLTLEALDQ